MTLSELLSARTAAGSRYNAATNELHAALVDLGGIDEALQSAASGYDGRMDIRTFHDLPQTLGTLAHPKYALADTTTDWRDEIKARRDAILAQFK